MIGTAEYEEMLEEALKKLYFETEQQELLKEPLEMKARMELHTGKTMRQWEDICQLISRQPLESKPAQVLYHQSLRNAFLEANKNVREMEKRAEVIGSEGMRCFLAKYTKGNEERVEELSKRMQQIQSFNQLNQNSIQQQSKVVKKIPVSGGLATVANDFMPASKALPTSSNNNKKPRREPVSEEEEDVMVMREGLSKDSSIQSSLGHYFQPNHQHSRKPKAFQPPQKSTGNAAISASNNSAPAIKEEINDERLTGIDPKLIEIITSEVNFKSWFI